MEFAICIREIRRDQCDVMWAKCDVFAVVLPRPRETSSRFRASEGCATARDRGPDS